MIDLTVSAIMQEAKQRNLIDIWYPRHVLKSFRNFDVECYELRPFQNKIIVICAIYYLNLYLVKHKVYKIRIKIINKILILEIKNKVLYLEYNCKYIEKYYIEFWGTMKANFKKISLLKSTFIYNILK